MYLVTGGAGTTTAVCPRIGGQKIKRGAYAIAGVLAVGALLRLALLAGRLSFGAPILQVGDELDYHRRAVNVLVHGIYSRQAEPPFLPDAFRSPGFPAMLSAFYYLVGTRPVAALVLVNLLNIATVALVLWLGTKLWDLRIGMWAGLMLALDVNHALSGTELLTETAGTIGAVCATWTTLLGWRSRSSPMLFLSGLIWGITALVRPTFIWVAAPLVCALAIHSWCNWRSLARDSAVLILGLLLAVGPWLIRNQVVFGTPSLSLEVGATMYEYNGAYILSAVSGKPWDEAQEELRLRLRDKVREGDQWQAYNDHLMRQEGLKLFLEHPLVAVRLQLQGMVRFFLAPNRQRLGRVLPEHGLWTQLWIPANALWWGTFMLSIYGAVRLLRQDRSACVLTVLLIIYVATLASMQGQGRFRVPVDPHLCILASFGIAALSERLSAKGRSRIGPCPPSQ